MILKEWSRVRASLVMALTVMSFSLIAVGETQSKKAVDAGMELASAGPLAFDDGSTLFVGDFKAGVVHAFDLKNELIQEQSGYVLGRAETFEGRTIIDGLDKQVAMLLGAPVEQITINDMVVHKPSKQIFMSVHRGLGPDAEPVVLRVNRGVLELVDLSKASHSAQKTDPVPTSAKFEFGQPINMLAITDIDFFGGELFVAGLSNEGFSSTLWRMNFPFENKVSSTAIEIWHAVHAQYETRAPIIAQSITELDGEANLIAIYACTPIVRIALSELQDGAQVRGEMIGEMGFGNTPIDIVSYVNGWDKSQNVLVTNTNRSAVQISLDALASAELMPAGKGVQPNFTVAGVSQNPMPLAGTLHLDTADENWAIAIRKSPEDATNIQLHTLPLPFFFDRADHLVEMNWPDGPDPFGYKSAPPLTYN